MLFFILSVIIIYSAFMVVWCANPIHSVFYLVLVFLTASLYLFSQKVEYLSLLFVLVYIGAIAILFLFIVMMVDVKPDAKTNLEKEKEKRISFFFNTSSFFSFFNSFTLSVFFVGFLFSLKKNFVSLYGTPRSSSYSMWSESLDSLPNIDALGQLIYTNYFPFFLIAGIVLLVAMVGAIVLTLNFKKISKSQTDSRQISRGKKNSIYRVK